MNTFFTCFLIAVSLSMDAFSLSLIYGTYGLSRSNELLLALIVGIFHFFMPLLVLMVGNFLVSKFMFDLDIMVGIIFFIIGVEMLLSTNKEDEIKILINFWGFLLFGLSVSIDSFTTGIGMSVISDKYFLVSSMFMIISSIFTYIGLRFGNKLNEKFGKYATVVGGMLLCFLAICQIL